MDKIALSPHVPSDVICAMEAGVEIHRIYKAMVAVRRQLERVEQVLIMRRFLAPLGIGNLLATGHVAGAVVSVLALRENGAHAKMHGELNAALFELHLRLNEWVHAFNTLLDAEPDRVERMAMVFNIPVRDHEVNRLALHFDYLRAA